MNIGVSMLLTSSKHSENHIISTYKDVSRKVSEAITQKYLMSAVSRALPLSGDMTSELHRENCRFASDTLNANSKLFES